MEHGAGVNEVALVGRMAAPAEERVLPSGDVLLSWRLVVDRPPPRTPPVGGRRPPTIDTVDCVALSGNVRRAARRFERGDVVRVDGSLRRRFWRSGGGAPASRTEVEVVAARRLKRAQASR